jgi:hypothetical protein
MFGAVVNDIWSICSPPGNSDRTNQLYLNPFAHYHFADGWSIGSSPEITANWVASGGKWTVAVGGGFGKAFGLGGQAMRLDFNAFYNAIRPKAGNDTWLLQVKLTFNSRIRCSAAKVRTIEYPSCERHHLSPQAGRGSTGVLQEEET